MQNGKVSDMAPRGNFLGAANRLKTSPIPVQRTTRAIPQRVLTSLNAGQFMPLLAIPLLREDSVSGATFRIGFEMEETVEVLMNAVNVRVRAFLVSNLCKERFDGLDSINKSYEGLPLIEGGAVTPWFETIPGPAHASAPILVKLGTHWREGDAITTDYIEAYNAIWNLCATQRSPDIPLRTRLDMTIAPSFWQHQTFAHIVPDFDQAIIDGEVALNVANAKMPVKGIGTAGPIQDQAVQTYRDSTATDVMSDGWMILGHGGALSSGQSYMFMEGQGVGPYPNVWAELQNDGITVSLSNIELARKTQAFANLRRQYSGHSDEYIIDLLMDGITIPDQMWKQPILLGDVSTQFGMSKRYASDGANLTESVVNGMTFLEMRFSCPRVPVGGVIMLVAEIAPEQLFERQKDPYLHASSVDDLPQFLRDTLDPEKVVVVQNDEMDIDHDVPDGTFGYAPLNHQWMRAVPRLGGKFYRPQVDAGFDEDRQRVWAVETANPVLSKDFYLCTTMHYKPFVVTDAAIDHFECLVRGQIAIRGNTVFGGLLVEASDDYAEVMEEAPVDRIEKPVGTDVQSTNKKKEPVNKSVKPDATAKPANKKPASTTPNEANK